MWSLTRQVVVFMLGVAVIIDSLVTEGTHVTELLVGVFLLGLVPLDSLLERLPQPWRRDTK